VGQHRAVPYAIALALALLAAGVRAALGFPAFAPFLPFYAAMTTTALVGGRGPGYFCAVTGAFLALRPFAPSMTALLSTPGLGAGIAMFALMCIVAVEVVVWLTNMAVRLSERDRQLSQRADALDASLGELQALYDHSPVGISFIDREMRFVRINAALAEINGATIEGHIGKRVWDVVPDLEEDATPALRRVLDSGETIRNIEFTGETRAQPGVERHWVETFYPIPAEDGSVQGVGILCEEVTELRRARDREKLLLREVDHRARNLLAVIQSIVKLTHWQGDAAAFKTALSGRIHALARIHTLIADNRWDNVTLSEVIRLEVEPFGTAVEVTEGEARIDLPPAAAQAISMVLHELATNSAKYGALSDEGKVLIETSLTPGEPQIVTLSWREVGGPTITKTGAEGFGTRLIRTSAEGMLGGKLDYRLEPEGLICSMSFPLVRKSES
jgi:two-component system CheB/CheR fusion protein